MIISLSPHLPLSHSLFLTPFLSPFFMQDPKNSHTRKRWYQRAIEATTLWKALSKPIDFPITNISSPWKSRTKTTQLKDQNDNTPPPSSRKLRKCSSTKTTTVSPFSRHVYCLCAPISSSYTDIFQTNVVVPRRSCSNYGRSRSLSLTTSRSRGKSIEVNIGRVSSSVEGRKMFRGKSLRDDVLMRRFVVEEMMMKKVRRRNEMELIRRRSGMRRNNIGPSPSSKMVLAN